MPDAHHPSTTSHATRVTRALRLIDPHHPNNSALRKAFTAHQLARNAYLFINNDRTLTDLVGTWARVNRILMEIEP